MFENVVYGDDWKRLTKARAPVRKMGEGLFDGLVRGPVVDGAGNVRMTGGKAVRKRAGSGRKMGEGLFADVVLGSSRRVAKGAEPTEDFEDSGEEEETSGPEVILTDPEKSFAMVRMGTAADFGGLKAAEEMAWKFVRDEGTVKALGRDGSEHGGRVLESRIVREAGEIEGVPVSEGDWLLVVALDAEGFAAVDGGARVVMEGVTV